MLIATAHSYAPATARNRAGSRRIESLDAFRGIAVLWVMLFHYAYYWTPADSGANLLPYGDDLAGLPLANVGFLGVQLFFLISGYVISLTLMNTASLRDFAIKRIARLWPPLIVCGTLTFIAAHLIAPDILKVSAPEYLFSLIILPPEHAGKLFGQHDWQWLDGAYWSLWVEVRFYAVIGVLFFLFRKNWLAMWGVFEAAGWAALILARTVQTPGADILQSLLFAHFTPFFSLGIVCFLFQRGRFGRTETAITVLAGLHLAHLLIMSFALIDPLSLLAGYGLIALLFGAFAFAPERLAFLESDALVHTGQASYSLYLLHQVIGVSLIIATARFLPAWGAPMAALFVSALLIAAAMQIYRYVERPANKAIVASLIPRKEVL